MKRTADTYDAHQLAGENGKPLLDSFGESYCAPGGHHCAEYSAAAGSDDNG